MLINNKKNYKIKSKMSRRAQSRTTKKTEVITTTKRTTQKETPKLQISKEDIDNLTTAFEYFDSEKSGKLNLPKVIKVMEEVKFDEANPLIYETIIELSNNKRYKDGLELNDFLSELDKKVNDTKSEEGLKRVFEVMIDDPEQTTLTKEAFKKLAKKYGDDVTDDEVNQIFEIVEPGSDEISFESFYIIMNKKGLP